MAKQVKKGLIEKIKLFQETKIKTDKQEMYFAEHRDYAEAAMCKAMSNALSQVIKELMELFK